MTFSVTKTKGPVALLGPEFAPFLYASVGDEGNGMTLSVLSTLARRDLDPWQEAAELAVLPVEVATERLASFIAALPGMAGCIDAGKTANCLMLLLPQQTSSTASRSVMAHDALGTTRSSLVIWMIVMSLIIGAQAIAASRQPPAQTVQSHTSTASTIPPLKEPARSGQ